MARQKELLALEREAELAEAAQLLEGVPLRELCQRGVALQRLTVAACRTGLYGRTLVTFAGGSDLPAHTMTSGDIVGIREQSGDAAKPLASGVVVEVKSSSVVVAFEESWESLELGEHATLSLTKLANDVTYRRLLRSLDRISAMSCQLIANILLGISEPSEPHASLPPQLLDGAGELRWINDSLDTSQQAAVQFALQQRELAIIHGPPGTGKTTTVVEVICQAVAGGEKVLVCAPSNIAVDNLLERLVKWKIKCIRLGHPARVSGDLQRHSLEALITTSEETQIVRDIYAEIDGLVAGLKKGKKRGEEQRPRVRNEIRELRKELKVRERRVLKEVLLKAEVILGTLTSSGQDSPLKHLPENHFSMTVIDECSQALEMACWIPVPWAGKLLLAGDHLQLPPTILSTKAMKGLEVTLMERIIKSQGEKVVRMLTTQYRMNAAIMTWSSEALYEGRLRAGDEVAAHTLADLKHVERNELTETVLLLIDTAGCDMAEFSTADGVSKGNEGEAALVCLHVARLVAAGVTPSEIAVITPYNLQVELIRLNLKSAYPEVEVRSVDGYQGREKECVVLSLVRSNPDREVGFLAERRRLNVAVTRARRQVTAICDSETVGRDTFLKQFLNYLEEHGTLESASLHNDLPPIVRPKDVSSAFSVAGKVSRETVGGGGGGGGLKSEKTEKDKTKKKKSEQKKDPSEANSSTTLKHFIQQKSGEPRAEQAVQEREDRVRSELRMRVDAFLGCESQVLHFPSELTAQERRMVHEMAEELGLGHESLGEAKSRHLVLSKKVAEGKENIAAPPEAADVRSLQTSYQTAPGPDSAVVLVCSNCQKSVAKANMELHKLRCHTQPVRSSSCLIGSSSSSSSTSSSLVTKKKKAASVKKLPNMPKDADEDFDAVCEQFQVLNRVCNYDRCKTKTAVLGADCVHCRGRFCLSHALAEIHGCGDAAKLAARQQLFRDRVVYPGSGIVSHAPDPVKRNQLKKKLDKKLDTLSAGRRPKQESDK